MSPKIGMVIDTRAYALTSLRPIDRVRMAVNVVTSQGMRIATDGVHGVGRHGMTGGWVPDGRQHPRRVSLLGAVCIVCQPTEGLVVEEGAAEALDVSEVWVQGMADGFLGEVNDKALRLPSRELYLVGHRAGNLLFAEVTVECAECGTRRALGDSRCGLCR